MLKRIWLTVSVGWTALGLIALLTSEYPLNTYLQNGSWLMALLAPWVCGPLVLWIVRFIFLGSPTAKLPLRDFRFRRSGE